MKNVQPSLDALIHRDEDELKRASVDLIHVNSHTQNC